MKNVAVGTVIARRPPHRSRRAELPHRAPTSGHDAEPQEAQEIGHSVPVVEPSVPITLKMPGNIVRDLRAYSVTSGLTLGEIVTRAVTAFLATVRRRG
jgi:hypothetical protein